jgi:hypothetical protein
LLFLVIGSSCFLNRRLTPRFNQLNFLSKQQVAYASRPRAFASLSGQG